MMETFVCCLECGERDRIAGSKTRGVDGEHLKRVSLGSFEVDNVVEVGVDLFVDNDETSANGPSGDEVVLQGSAGGDGGGGPRELGGGAGDGSD
jgi:hypothetical protein